MQIEVGDIVYFIGAEPRECGHCQQDTADLIYRTVRARVCLINEIHAPIWQEEPCNCGSQCMCRPTTRYDLPPEVRKIKSYSVLLTEEELTYGPLPDSAIYTSLLDATTALDSPASRTVVLTRRPVGQMERQVGDLLRETPGQGA